MTVSVPQIKKRVTGGSPSELARSRQEPATLALAEYDGVLWATNRYWMTPAARVAPLLEQFNLAADGPGMFEVNTTVRRAGDDGLRLGRLMGTPEDYPEPVRPVTVAGHDAHVRLGDQLPWLAVHETAGGAVIGLPAEDLAWLADITGMQLSRPQAFRLGPDDHFGEVQVTGKGGLTGPVAITAGVIRTLKPGSYGTGPGSGPDYHPAVTETLGPRIIGLLMPVRLGG